MSRLVLEVNDLVHQYGADPVLNQVQLKLTEGKIACLLGASGCGKTTLLRCIAGFEPVLGGSITINGRLVSSRDRFVPPEKRKIGVVFQDYALFPHLSVRDNIAFGIRHLPEEELQEKVNKLLESVDLKGHADKLPAALSGGQQQRVALARALAPEPELLLLDEPFSNLDSGLRDRMKMELKALLEFFGVTALMVTHNQDEAFDIAHEIGVMSGGEILEWGQPYDLYHRPSSREVASFLGMSAFLPAEVTEDGCVMTELGEVVCKEDLKTLEGSRITIMLRPDDIVLDKDGQYQASVERLSFRGMYIVYHLSLASGQEIHCFTSSHDAPHQIGDKVGIALGMKHAVLLKEDEALVENITEESRPKH